MIIREIVFPLCRASGMKKIFFCGSVSLGCVALAIVLATHFRLLFTPSVRYSYSSAEQRKEGNESNLETFLESFELERQRMRKERVYSVCQKLNATGQLLLANKSLVTSIFSQMFVDDNRRILYCSVPKVACTNWKRVLLMLTGKMKTKHISNLKRYDVHGKMGKTYLRKLKSYTIDEIKMRINSYYKFMFVRDPLERILSAYSDKFVSEVNTKLLRNYGKRIVSLYRAHPTEESLRRGHDVTFEEFVAYLLDPRTTKTEPFNIHWRPYYELCHPCFIQYDFIGKYETIQEDADLILRQLGVRNIVSFPPFEKRVKTSDLLGQMFSNISTVDIHRLWKLYSIDFDLFDYPYPALGLKFS